MDTIKRLGAALGMFGLLLSSPASADATVDVKAAFERFIAAQNARDMETLKSLLLDTPNFLWIVGGTCPVGNRRADDSLSGLPSRSGKTL
jgi:hypothetical protein